MKVIEIINFNRELLKKLQEAGVRLEDVQYVDLYSEYSTGQVKGRKYPMSLPCFLKNIRSVRERFMP